MAKNKIYDVPQLALVATHPTTPASGNPCRVGNVVGVALGDEQADGKTVIDLEEMVVYDLSVKGEQDAGDVAVALYDPLYYVDADIDDGTGTLSKKTTGGIFAGWALEAVGSGLTDTINILMAHSRP